MKEILFIYSQTGLCFARMHSILLFVICAAHRDHIEYIALHNRPKRWRFALCHSHCALIVSHAGALCETCGHQLHCPCGFGHPFRVRRTVEWHSEEFRWMRGCRTLFNVLRPDNFTIGAVPLPPSLCARQNQQSRYDNATRSGWPYSSVRNRCACVSHRNVTLENFQICHIVLHHVFFLAQHTNHKKEKENQIIDWLCVFG